MSDLRKTERYNGLYDLYKGLLTEKQQRYFEHYYHLDYSLAEIADLLNISRNAVFDQLKKTEQLLDHYESVLLLEHKRSLRTQYLEELKRTKDLAWIEKIEAID